MTKMHVIGDAGDVVQVGDGMLAAVSSFLWSYKRRKFDRSTIYRLKETGISFSVIKLILWTEKDFARCHTFINSLLFIFVMSISERLLEAVFVGDFKLSLSELVSVMFCLFWNVRVVKVKFAWLSWKKFVLFFYGSFSSFKIMINLKNLGNLNFILFEQSPFFISHLLAVIDANKSKSLPIAQVPYFFRAIAGQPLFTALREFCDTIVWTGSCNYVIRWNLIVDEVVEFIWWLVCVKHFCTFNFAVIWINYSYVHASKMITSTLIPVHLNGFIIDTNHGEVASIIPCRWCLYDQCHLGVPEVLKHSLHLLIILLQFLYRVLYSSFGIIQLFIIYWLELITVYMFVE